jgi:hypothetical protein
MTNKRELLPEEKAVGSADPAAQAELILEESEERARHPEKAEARTSDEATPPIS